MWKSLLSLLTQNHTFHSRTMTLSASCYWNLDEKLLSCRFYRCYLILSSYIGEIKHRKIISNSNCSLSRMMENITR